MLTVRGWILRCLCFYPKLGSTVPGTERRLGNLHRGPRGEVTAAPSPLNTRRNGGLIGAQILKPASSVERQGARPGFRLDRPRPSWDSVFLLTREIHTLRGARVRHFRPPRPPPPPPPHSTQKPREKAPGWSPRTPAGRPPCLPRSRPGAPRPRASTQGYLSSSEERGARRWAAPGQEPTLRSPKHGRFQLPKLPRPSGQRTTAANGRQATAGLSQ